MIPHTDLRSQRYVAIGTAVFAGMSAVGMATEVLSTQPRFRAVPWGEPLVAILMVLALVSLAIFARRPASLGPPIAALIALRLEHDIVGTWTGIYSEPYYPTGAVLLGWIAGLLYARALGLQPGKHSEHLRTSQALASAAALACLAGLYLNAGLSKLVNGGWEWLYSDTIRLVVASHRHLDAPSWQQALTQAVMDEPGVGIAMQFGTVMLELGAVFLLAGPRARIAAALGLLAMHRGIHITTHIGFSEPQHLLLLYCFPWLRILRRPVPVPSPLVFPARERPRLAQAVVGGVALLVGLVWLMDVPARDHPLVSERQVPDELDAH